MRRQIIYPLLNQLGNLHLLQRLSPCSSSSLTSGSSLHGSRNNYKLLVTIISTMSPDPAYLKLSNHI
jgi:hypothetical protein